MIGRQGLGLFAFWKNDRFSKSDAHRLATVRGGVICSQEILFEFIECFGLAFPSGIFREVITGVAVELCSQKHALHVALPLFFLFEGGLVGVFDLLSDEDTADLFDAFRDELLGGAA